LPASADSTEVNAFHEGFLLRRDKKNSAEPYSERKIKSGQESGPTLSSFCGAANAPEVRK
jgi:hypothetical protein